MKTTAPVKPEKGQSDEPSDERKRPPYFPVMLLLAGLIAILFASSDFWKRFYDDPSLDNAEVEAAQREAEEVAYKHENWIQYVLRANTTMQRPCLRCPNGITKVTVKAGEIYRYGITTQGRARYDREFLRLLELRMEEEVYGNYITCKKAEINKIIAYRFLPESQKPEVKLIRPPGNANRN